jgi:hypothetical protein
MVKGVARTSMAKGASPGGRTDRQIAHFLVITQAIVANHVANTLNQSTSVNSVDSTGYVIRLALIWPTGQNLFECPQPQNDVDFSPLALGER